MKKIFFLFSLICNLLLPTLHATTFTGKVVGISDGDTIKILDSNHNQFTIRLMGIDAPEKAQSFGQRSKQSLSEQIFQHNVEVQWTKQDKYKRIIGKVLDENGHDVCLEQVTRGMAWHYKQYAKDQTHEDQSRYSDAEKKAKESSLGLWQEPHPMPPWQWRHSNKH